MHNKNAKRPTRRALFGCAIGGISAAAAPIREEPEEVIPLKSVVASVGQKGLLAAPQPAFLTGDNPRKRNLFLASDIGPSNLFFVTAKDIEDAMEATFRVLCDGERLDYPFFLMSPKKEPSKNLWAFVYFGAAQSFPAEWTVTRVSLQRDRVRVTVSRPDRSLLGNFDERVYMFWAPLGEPKQKGYTLEAYDETNRVMLMTRRVCIPETKRE